MDRLRGVPILKSFGEVTQAHAYAPLADDWLVGVTDVTRSSEAIAAGRYKTVNIAGAAAISAVMNAIRTRQFPFAFMGDGCALALPGRDAQAAREALAKTAAWVRDDLGLELRTALVSVATLRAEGADVRVALFRPSPHVGYAMFDGGGVGLAERQMKDGRFRVPPAGPGERPDLSGLSCRWLPIRSRRGAVVSVIVQTGAAGDAAFRRAASGLLVLLGEAGHPVPDGGPRIAPVTPGARLEALASRGRRPLWWRVVQVSAHHLMGWALFVTGLRVGRFDPRVYRALTSANADSRKFGDALLLTVDADPALEAAISSYLSARAGEGAVR